MSRQQQLLDRILHLSHLVQADQERELEALDLTPSRTAVMWIVHRDGPRMQRDIAAEMDVTPRHVTTLVDDLVEAGLAYRGPHPSDRRAVLVSLSEKGTSLMETMALQHRELADALTDGWSDADIALVTARLDALAERFSVLMADASREDGAA